MGLYAAALVSNQDSVNTLTANCVAVRSVAVLKVL